MASNYTTNYKLPLWEGGDSVLREEFNEAHEKMDTAIAATAKIAAGTYTGDGTAERVIELGFAPKCVYVCPPSGNLSHSTTHFFGGFAVVGSPAITGYTVDPNPVTVVENGFRVLYHQKDGRYVLTNNEGQVYHYFALG